jgi:Rieske Fe-S protein
MEWNVPKKRRVILKGLFATSFAAFAAPIIYISGKYLGFAVGATGRKIAKLSASVLTPDSPSKLIQIAGEPIIVVRESDNVIRAFTAVCTHLGCTVSYKQKLPGMDQPGFFCKCHQGKYFESGVNIPGTRPKRPLTELTVIESADDLEIRLTPKAKT